MTYYDVSLVDGYSISVDVVPGAHSPTRPGDPTNPFWCKSGLCNPRVDLRSICPENYTLWGTGSNSEDNPRTKIACFSNCGLYEYPVAPEPTCSDADPKCKGWRKYCCQAETYGKACITNKDCTDGGACWDGVCACKAYYATPPCNKSVCTFPAAQPKAGDCSGCVGDDTVHSVCPRAYSWPNDPQTYSCDATDYTIIFCPGGTTEPMSPITGFPACSSLNSTQYDWSKARIECANSHGTYLCAVKKGSLPTDNWQCDVTHKSCVGVTCSWN